MKVRKVDPDALWKERTEAFLELTPLERLAWLNEIQNRFRAHKMPAKLKLIKKVVAAV